MKKNLPLLYFCIILSLSFPTHAQNNSTQYNDSKGDLNIANWTPIGGNDGVFIEIISLEYSYGIDSTEPKQMLNMVWYIGNYVIINGKKFTKEEIGEALYKKIVITGITFKPKCM